jgi:hypothetical protein
MEFIKGENRGQIILLPESIEEYVEENGTVRIIDAYINNLDLEELGFNRRQPTGGTETTPAASGGQAAQAQQQAAQVLQGTPSAQTQQKAVTYKIGDTGPAGGLIFYDKGNSIGGWRYLEAAPAGLGPTKFLMESPESFPENLYKLWERTEGDNGRSVGKGKYNSEYLMQIAQLRGGFGWAAYIVDNYVRNGFNDWFVPSRDELNFMYGNLYLKGLGNLRPEQYWSSTGWTNGCGEFRAWYINFADGKHDTVNASQQHRVRPVRQF